MIAGSDFTTMMREALGNLSEAVSGLDTRGVEAQCSHLQSLLPALSQSTLNVSNCAELRNQVRRAKTLCRNATELYAGWARLAVPQGQSYSRNGDELAPGAVSSLAVRG